MMFAQNGYENVSMRDLADTLGIRASSLYNHFASKKDILHVLYDAYNTEHMRTMPDIDELLCLAETASPMEVFSRLNNYCNPGVGSIMDRIFAIATRHVSSDADSAALAKNNLLDLSAKYLKPVLEKMIAIGKIEPVDVDTFIFLIAVYGFGGSALNTSSMEISREDWTKGYAMLCTLIKPTGK